VSIGPPKSPGVGLLAPAGLVRSPPTVNVVDVSADGYRDDDGDRALPGVVTLGTNALLHDHQQQMRKQEQPKTAPHYVSRLPRHMSERSLLMPRSSSEFDVPEQSRRRSTAV